jgi:hypothetical protein
LTLAQVLGFFGGTADCTDLLQLLGVNSNITAVSSNSTSAVTNSTITRRGFERMSRPQLFRFARRRSF